MLLGAIMTPIPDCHIQQDCPLTLEISILPNATNDDPPSAQLIYRQKETVDIALTTRLYRMIEVLIAQYYGDIAKSIPLRLCGYAKPAHLASLIAEKMDERVIADEQRIYEHIYKLRRRVKTATRKLNNLPGVTIKHGYEIIERNDFGYRIGNIQVNVFDYR